MCRSIRTLFNIAPAATSEEIRAASLQFVRKVSGFRAPSRVNAAAFDTAVDEIESVVTALLGSLQPGAAPRDRVTEAAHASVRSRERLSR